jgi:hypothetical protein
LNVPLRADFDLAAAPVINEQPLLQDVAANQAGEEWLTDDRARYNARSVQTGQFTFWKANRSGLLWIFPGFFSDCVDLLVNQFA